MNKLSNIKGYLEDSEGTITTCTPYKKPSGIRDSKGYRPSFATIVYVGCEEEFTKEELWNARDFVLSVIPNVLRRSTNYCMIIKPLWFQQLLLKKEIKGEAIE